jgi:hypothetical protein
MTIAEGSGPQRPCRDCQRTVILSAAKHLLHYSSVPAMTSSTSSPLGSWCGSMDEILRRKNAPQDDVGPTGCPAAKFDHLHGAPTQKKARGNFPGPFSVSNLRET